MSTPVIGEVRRDIPGHIPKDVENQSGFPFDDQDFEREGSYSFRSQLDDLAKRHPEFAEHLNFGNTSFPFRSHTLGRHRRGSDLNSENPSGSHDAEFRRHADRPFGGSRFEQFGFPFSRHFEDEPDFYYKAAAPRSQSPEQVPKEPPGSPQPTVEKPPQTPQNYERGRKQNIQQSNTVDLGQKQDPVDENRSQRSMSAPPENRSTGKRFISSINIPIHQQRAGGDMGARSSQPEPQPQPTQAQSGRPNERVIPIHVEGRDEPVIPKNVNTQQSAPSQTETERVFGHNPTHFTQFLNKGEPQGPTPEKLFRQQQFQKQQQQPNYQPQPQQPQPQQQQPQTTREPPPQAKPVQIDQIQIIQKDVSELMNKVQNFEGKLRDKEYLYLDEMLTRNLIKLDNIETEGKENIRQARKEAIKCIEGCIGILEAKANANAVAAAAAAMEIEPQPPIENAEPSTDLIAAEKEHAVDTSASLEVSGVVRSGSVVAEPATMDVEKTTENTTKEAEITVDVKNEGQATDETKTEQPAEVKPEVEPKTESMEVTQATTDEASQNVETDAKLEEKKEKKKGKKKEKTEKN